MERSNSNCVPDLMDSKIEKLPIKYVAKRDDWGHCGYESRRFVGEGAK